MNGAIEQFRQKAQGLIEGWAVLWNCPALKDGCLIESSSRMSRSIGLAYPSRKLIRLNRNALWPKSESRSRFESDQELLRAQVLCHEAAHIAVFLLWGNKPKPHGPEWCRLVRLAGYDPTRTLAVETIDPSPKVKRQPLVYIHRCPECGSQRTAKRAMRDWRCIECVKSGSSGKLQITTQPRCAKVTPE